jgi:hypothetical protein
MKEAPERPEAPEAPEKPEMKEAPERPEAPEAPEKPEAPEVPERPEATEIPERAELPEKGDGWGIIAHLDRGRIHTSRRINPPNAPEAPEAPEAPAKVTINLQDCLNAKGYCITVADNQGECVVIVKDKSRKIVEAVPLTDWDKDKGYEEKYGETPSRQRLPKYVKGKYGKPVVLTDLRPVPAVNRKQTIRLNAIPAPTGNAKPVELTDLKPVPAVNAKPAIRTDTKSARAGNEKPIKLTNLKVSFSSSADQ